MFKKSFFALLVVVLLLTACASATPTAVVEPVTPEATQPEPTQVLPTATYETVHLTIASYPYITEAPYFIAQANGYFAEQGLEVEFIRFQASSEVIPALAAGDLDVSTVFPSAAFFNAVGREASIRIVAGKGYLDPTGCTSTAFMARSDLLTSGALTDPANWVGMKIATERAAMAEFVLETLLIQNGLTLEDVEIVDLPAPNRLEGLQNAAVDIAGAGEPWLSRIRNAGAADVWMSFNDILPDSSWGLVAFGPSLLVERPDVGQRFMVAFLKGLADYNEGKTESNIATLAANTQLDPAEVEAMCWNAMMEDGSINAASLIAYQEWAVGRGYLTAVVGEEMFWDPQFIEYAQSMMP